MADDLPLSADFPPAAEAQWQALAEKALEGAPLSKITTKTEHGVPVRPLYRRADWGADASGLPGAAAVSGRGAAAATGATTGSMGASACIGRGWPGSGSEDSSRGSGVSILSLIHISEPTRPY